MTHSKTKPTETLKFGTEKGLLQGHTGRQEVHALRNPMLPDHFAGRVFKGEVRGERCSVYDFLLFGWWGDNRDLVLSLKLPSSTWAGALVLAEGLKGMLCTTRKEEPGPCFIEVLLFLDSSSFVSASSLFPS